MDKFGYQIFAAENKSLSIYELARKNPKPIYIVKVTDFRLYHLYPFGIECRVRFSNDYDNSHTFIVTATDKKRLAKKIENVVKSYCNNFGFAYAKTSSIRSARNKLAKEPVKPDTTDKKELLYKIDKMERKIRKLKEQLYK